ncbi:hypothetical protein EV580_1313 [Mycobacterium sp. BK086]|uniref:fibronectin type III domain-containing protein n=1 Tax=Mycobacterium sp. BK086 TaxID=2512165 RepID=UPI00105F91DB|nr:fibronectin type III domain-containing protein [Mycobacterium sp. BK086]TDO18131.1 hypothetical protein EV580_1313 [Mycobacterium sp. BK086]
MVASLGNPDAKPYGLHRVWITPYIDTDGTILADTSYRLPLARTFAFAESEDTDSLDGDDKAGVAQQGKGATADCSLEAGGLDLMCFSIFSGARLIESGVEPNVQRKLRKRSSDPRPYFRVEGQVISNGGGDTVARVFRCKANGKISADMKYGTFMCPTIDIKGSPMPGDTDDYLWEFDFNEQRTTLGSTPTPNPLPIPSNLTVGTLTATTAVLDWNDIAVADSFKVKVSTDGITYTAVTSGHGGEPSSSGTTVTTLTAATAYYAVVAAVVDGVTGDYSEPVTFTTAAS